MRAVIQVAMGEEPDLTPLHKQKSAAVRFVFSEEDIEVLNKIKVEHPDYIITEETGDILEEEITDSSNRFGVYVMSALNSSDLEKYLPAQLEE